MNFCSERVLIVVTKMKRKALMLYKDAPKFTFTKNEPAFASILCTIHTQKLKLSPPTPKQVITAHQFMMVLHA